MTLDELAAVLRVHQGPFFNGIGSNCSCGRPVRTADEWARHVAEEIASAEKPVRLRRLVAANCKRAEGKGYPISTGDVCFACQEEDR